VQAHATVSVVRQDGHDRLVTLRSDPPLTLRPTPAGLHLVGTSAGPLAGDDLRLDVAVGAGAELTVRSVAATLAQPGARPGPSTLRIEIDVGAGGRLVWGPQPTVLVRGCDHEIHVRVRLGAGARLVWRDEIVLGRHGEESGSLLSRLAVDRAGLPVLRNDLVVGGRGPGSLGPAGVGADTRAVGTVVIVGPEAAAVRVSGHGADVRAAVLPLAAADAVLVTAVSPAPGAVATWLDDLLERGLSRERLR
jgi:urease accessory protein